MWNINEDVGIRRMSRMALRSRGDPGGGRETEEEG